MTPGAQPRVAPLPEADWTEEQYAALCAASGTDTPARTNWFTTIVRHPQLQRRFVSFGAELIVRGRLRTEDRELIALRTAWLCQGDYEWGHHVAQAHARGFDDAYLERVVAGPGHATWTSRDRALLAATDELHEHATIGDDVWGDLRRHYDEQQVIEIPFVVGLFHTIAFAQNAFRVQRPPDVGGLDTR